jgi:hypothetical protein
VGAKRPLTMGNAAHLPTQGIILDFPWLQKIPGDFDKIHPRLPIYMLPIAAIMAISFCDEEGGGGFI